METQTTVHTLHVKRGNPFYISIPTRPRHRYVWRVDLGAGMQLLGDEYAPCTKDKGILGWKVVSSLPTEDEIIFERRDLGGDTAFERVKYLVVTR